MWVGPNVRSRRNGMYGMYGMWYLGELTKLCAYDFQFMFQVLLVPIGSARVDCIAPPTWIPLSRYHFDCYDVEILFSFELYG